jgi:ribonuclease T2
MLKGSKILKPLAPQNTSFDFFLFVLQWDSSVSTDYFTIHGLWPEYNNGNYPSNCPGPAFNVSAIQDLVNNLDQYWPSNQGGNDDFWEHEWSKHGTCSNFGQHAYFQNALIFQNKFDIKSALDNANIVPSSSKKYTASSISQAIDRSFGATPALHCDSSTFSEAAVCLTKSLSLMDCPSNLGSYFQCPSSVTYD